METGHCRLLRLRRYAAARRIIRLVLALDPHRIQIETWHIASRAPVLAPWPSLFLPRTLSWCFRPGKPWILDFAVNAANFPDLRLVLAFRMLRHDMLLHCSIPFSFLLVVVNSSMGKRVASHLVSGFWTIHYRWLMANLNSRACGLYLLVGLNKHAWKSESEGSEKFH